jgi:biopolymer transport protein TolR
VSAPPDFEDEDEPQANINIVPFVDVALVLLIIFILTSRVMARASFPVDVPRAANAGSAVQATANVVVTAARELFLDGARVDAGGLDAELKRRTSDDPKLRAVISADKTLPYEQVIDVIDIVKGAGVASFALNVECSPRTGQ